MAGAALYGRSMGDACTLATGGGGPAADKRAWQQSRSSWHKMTATVWSHHLKKNSMESAEESGPNDDQTGTLP